MKRVIFILFGIIVLFFAGVYLLYQPAIDKFPASTRLNGIDVSGLTVEEAEDKVTEKWNSKDFTFAYKGEFYPLSLSSLTFDVPAEEILPSLTRLEKFKYFLNLLHIPNVENRFTVPVKPNESDEFSSQIAALPFCDNKDKEKTQDAYVDLSDFEFRTVEEKIGTEVDPVSVKNIAFANIEKGSFTTELTDRHIIKQPELRVGTPEFEERLKYCKDNLSYKLEFESGGVTEVVTPQLLDEMVSYKDGKPKFNKKKIKKYAETLAGIFNEYNKDYPFTTHGGRKISVRGVTFGKVLDKDAMVTVLKDAMTEKKSQELELKWAQTKIGDSAGIGDSYIEVSIEQQHVWCYKNGEVIVDCDCVTGMPGHDTARGVFVVQYVTGPTVLKGNNDDGTTYESPVNCFVPFYGGQGFHGSSGWRSQWGGTIYQTGGSHGCVNCPDDAAKKIADNVYYGYPVVIY